MGILSRVAIASLLVVFFGAVNAGDAKVVKHQPLEQMGYLIPEMEYLWHPEITNMTLPQAQASDAWKSVDGSSINLGYVDEPVWLRFRVPSGVERRLLVEIRYPLIDEVVFYHLRSGVVAEEYRSGESLPFAQRPVKHRNFLFPFNPSQTSSEDIYLKLKSEGAMQVPLRIWTPSAFFEQVTVEDQLHSVYYGVLITVIFFNLFVYFALKERTYLLYALSTTSLLLLVCALNGTGYRVLWSDFPEVQRQVMVMLIPLTMFLTLMFSREFLRLSVTGPRTDWLFKMGMLLSLVALVLSFFLDYSASSLVSIIIVIPCSLLLTAVGPFQWARGNPQASYYTVAWACLTIAMGLASANKYGLIPNSFLTFYGLQIGSGLEAFILNLALAKRLYQEREDKIQAQAESLRKGQELLLHEQRELESSKQYATKLEFEVKRRTNELEESLKEVEALNDVIGSAQEETVKYLNKVQALLNNSGEGFLSVGNDLRVEEGFSRECQHLFEQSDLEGKSVATLLSPDDADNRELIEGALDAVLNKAVPASMVDTYLSLLPSSYELGSRRCEARYRLLPDKKRLMIVLNDITHKEELKRRIEDERIQLKRTVYAVTQRDEFMQIMSDFEKFLDRDIREESAQDGVESVSVDLHRQLHTFKSLFAQASCVRLAQVLHEREDTLRELKDGGRSATPEAVLEKLNRPLLRATLQEELAPLQRELGEDFFDQGRCFTVPDELVNQLEAQVKNLADPKSDLLGLVRTIRFEPLHSMLMSHIHMSHNLASQMGKRLKPTVISGPNPRLDPSVWGEPLRVLVHLFRNAVDHGIEMPDERIAEDKPEQGRLECWVEVDDSTLRLYIEDDGRGLSVSALRERAVGKGLMSTENAAELSDEQAMELIFEEGFSSRDKVSSLSGRGVGLAAVKEVIEKRKGNISIQSYESVGTTFIVSLPCTEITTEVHEWLT